jgi:hypothetical protein
MGLETYNDQDGHGFRLLRKRFDEEKASLSLKEETRRFRWASGQADKRYCYQQAVGQGVKQVQ